MKFVYIINIMACLFTAVAFAQDEQPKQENVISVPRTEAIYQGSSRFNRQGKSNLAVGQIGLNSNLGAIGGAFGWYLNSNSILTVETLFGGDSTSSDHGYWTSSGRWGYKNDTKATFVGVHVKTFVGNTFYYKLGGEAKSIKYRYTSFDDLITADNYERRFDGSAFGAVVAVGNQWQWRGFTMGVDWVGAHIPLTSKITDEYTDGSSSQKKRLKEDTEKYVTNVSLNALNLYIGASF